MKFDPVTIVLAIIGLIITCVGFIFWLVYEHFVKSSKFVTFKRTTNKFEELYKNMDIRMTKLEDRTDEIMKDINLIKKKLDM